MFSELSHGHVAVWTNKAQMIGEVPTCYHMHCTPRCDRPNPPAGLALHIALGLKGMECTPTLKGTGWRHREGKELHSQARMLLGMILKLGKRVSSRIGYKVPKVTVDTKLKKRALPSDCLYVGRGSLCLRTSDFMPTRVRVSKDLRIRTARIRKIVHDDTGEAQSCAINYSLNIALSGGASKHWLRAKLYDNLECHLLNRTFSV